ncbi:hypothetical protein [Hymenobacter ruber]
MKYLAIALIIIALLAAGAYVAVRLNQPDYFGYTLLALFACVFWIAIGDGFK